MQRVVIGLAVGPSPITDIARVAKAHGLGKHILQVRASSPTICAHTELMELQSCQRATRWGKSLPRKGNGSNIKGTLGGIRLACGTITARAEAMAKM